jgi:hypothetical protein
MPDYTPEHLAELIALLPPAPPGWVESAQELPSASRAIDDLVSRAEAHVEERSAMLADLEATLRTAGVEPRRVLVEQLRTRLSGE